MSEYMHIHDILLISFKTKVHQSIHNYLKIVAISFTRFISLKLTQTCFVSFVTKVSSNLFSLNIYKALRTFYVDKSLLINYYQPWNIWLNVLFSIKCRLNMYQQKICGIVEDILLFMWYKWICLVYLYSGL